MRSAAQRLKPLATSRFLASFWLLLFAAILSLTAPLAARADTLLNSVLWPAIGVGNDPTGEAISPDGQFIYVANDIGGTVSVIATATNTLEGTITGFNASGGPIRIVFSPTGEYAYVTNSNIPDHQFSVIATAVNTTYTPYTIVDTITVGTRPLWGAAITPNGQFVYVVSSASNAVYAIATASNTVVAGPITVGSNPRDLAVTPDGQYVYVVNRGDNVTDGSVSVIATATNTVVNTITVGVSPRTVAITPNGQFAYVSNNSDGTVSVIATAINTTYTPYTVVATITVGANPLGVAFTPPDGQYAYVPNSGDGTVSVIATATNTVVNTLTLCTNTTGTSCTGNGLGPYSIVLTPDGQFAYVTDAGDNSGNNAVSVFTVAAITPSLPDGFINAPYTTTITVTSPDLSSSTCAITSGDAPPGMTLDASTCKLTGTPTKTGSYAFTATANGTVRGLTEAIAHDYTVVIRAAVPAAPIPTLNDVALVLLVLLLGASAAASMYRRRR